MVYIYLAAIYFIQAIDCIISSTYMHLNKGIINSTYMHLDKWYIHIELIIF